MIEQEAQGRRERPRVPIAKAREEETKTSLPRQRQCTRTKRRTRPPRNRRGTTKAQAPPEQGRWQLPAGRERANQGRTTPGKPADASDKEASKTRDRAIVFFIPGPPRPESIAPSPSWPKSPATSGSRQTCAAATRSAQSRRGDFDTRNGRGCNKWGLATPREYEAARRRRLEADDKGCAAKGPLRCDDEG